MAGAGSTIDGDRGTQNSNNDLSRYKLSREELEDKRRARQHRPLEDYDGPPILVRASRSTPCCMSHVRMGVGVCVDVRARGLACPIF